MSPELGNALGGPRLGQDRLVLSLASSKHPDVNQDAFFLDAARGVGAVIDGLGGRANGDLASRLSRDAIKAVVHRRNAEGLGWPLAAVKAARNAVITGQKAYRNNMGATAVVAALDRGRASVAWCGDARAYGVTTDGALKLLTRDHGMVDAWRRHGLITPEQSASLEVMLDDVVAGFQAQSYGMEIEGLSEMLSKRPGVVNGLVKCRCINADKAEQLNGMLAGAKSPEVASHIGGQIAAIAFKNRSLVSSELAEPHGPIDEVVVPTDGMVAIVLMSDGIHDNLTTAEMTEVVGQTSRDLYGMSVALVDAARTSADSKLGRAKRDDMTALVLPVTQP